MANLTTDWKLEFTDSNQIAKIRQTFTADQKLVASATDDIWFWGDHQAALASGERAILFARRTSGGQNQTIATFTADATFTMASGDLRIPEGGILGGIFFDADQTTPGRERIQQNAGMLRFNTGGSKHIGLEATKTEFVSHATMTERVDASAEGFCTQAQSNVTGNYSGTLADGAIALSTAAQKKFYAYANSAWRSVNLSAA